MAANRVNMTGAWLLENRERVFAKTALVINCEHTSTLQTYLRAGIRVRSANTYTGLSWYAGGPSRPKLQELTVRAFKDFGVVTYAEPERVPPRGEVTEYSAIWPYVPVVQASDYNMY
jgi:hypothetical protein